MFGCSRREGVEESCLAGRDGTSQRQVKLATGRGHGIICFGFSFTPLRSTLSNPVNTVRKSWKTNKYNNLKM